MWCGYTHDDQRKSSDCMRGKLQLFRKRKKKTIIIFINLKNKCLKLLTIISKISFFCCCCCCCYNNEYRSRALVINI